MIKYRRSVLVSVLALGVALDILFWKQRPGINFAVYALLCVGAGLVLLRREGVPLARAAGWLLPLILIFASISFLRAEPLTVTLSILLTLFLMALLAITFTGGRWLAYNFADYALGFLRLGWSILTRPFEYVVIRPQAQRSGTHGLWPVIRGALIALPIVVLFAALLGSADLVFQRQLDAFVKLLSLERLPEYIFRAIYISLAAGAILGVYLHAALHSKDERLLGGTPGLVARALGFTEASIVLGSVALLFAAFVVIQFQYLFGGLANINYENFTYAEYARRGYGELLTVAFFSLLLILGLGALTRRESAPQKKTFSLLSIAIVALVGVMLISAYRRLALYEDAYGFSQLRTYTHVSLIWLGFLVAAVVVLELLGRERFSAAAVLLSAIGFAMTLAAINVDAFIVRHNVARAVHGEDLDVAYLASLSDDSVPPLAGLFASEMLPADVREQLGVALLCRLNFPGREPALGWRSFTLPGVRSRNALAAVEPALQEYRYIKDDWLGRVVTPRGTSIDCLRTSD